MLNIMSEFLIAKALKISYSVSLLPSSDKIEETILCVPALGLGARVCMCAHVCVWFFLKVLETRLKAF